MTVAATRRLAVVADDLIWSVRLAEQARLAEAEPVPVRDLAALEAVLAGAPRPAGVVVDLSARSYDGVEACRLAARAGVPVLAIGQHEDHELLRAARAAGAERAVVYRLMAHDGPAVLSLFLATDRTPTVRHADAASGDGGARRTTVGSPPEELGRESPR